MTDAPTLAPPLPEQTTVKGEFSLAGANAEAQAALVEALQNETLAARLAPGDRKVLTTLMQETTEWMSKIHINNPLRCVLHKGRLQQVENVALPIMRRLEKQAKKGIG